MYDILIIDKSRTRGDPINPVAQRVGEHSYSSITSPSFGTESVPSHVVSAAFLKSSRTKPNMDSMGMR